MKNSLDTEILKDITGAAAGSTAPDLVIKGGMVIDVFTRSIRKQDIVIKHGTIVHVSEQADVPAAKQIDAKGLFVAPGFIDAHIHIESSMLIPSRFAEAVIPHGTTAVVADPHEIANCFGTQGIRFMMEDGSSSPLSFYFTAPSCVPATLEFETSGAVLGPEQVSEVLDMDGVVALGEMMNFPGVIHGSREVLEKIAAARRRAMPVDGHAPGLTGKELSAYIVAGIDSDHEAFALEEALEKLEKGMYLFIRQGTTARNLEALLPAVNSRTLGRCCLVTDDRHPDELLELGHLDHLLAKAVALGLDPADAVTMVTLNPARRFGLAGHGALAPGYRADLVLLENLQDFKVDSVFIAGREVSSNERVMIKEGPATALPGSRMELDPDGIDLSIKAAGTRARVMEIVPGELVTRCLEMDVTIENGLVRPDSRRDIALVAVIERHRGTGNVGLGLVKGLGLKEGAIASTVAHDSHNLIVAGMDEESMISAAAALKGLGGGLAAALGDRASALALPVAGLMSPEPVQDVVRGLKEVLDFAARLGTSIKNPFMPLSFLALSVIPELKLTDKGLVDVNSFTFVPLFC